MITKEDIIMLQKVQAYITKYNMIQQRDHIIVGVSGGADSMCLLAMLLELQECYELRISVVHVNHLLREEAFAEAKYVETYCREKEISYYYMEKNIGDYVKKYSISIEEAGRMARYEAFQQVLVQQKDGMNCKIAVAHHENDLAETMLFHLIRGCGLGGLQGILPVQGNVIRPLLSLNKQEIEEYLDRKSILFYTDQSNFENEYSRNRIRNEVMPQLNKINNQAVHHMNETALRLREIELYLQREIKAVWEECVEVITQKSYVITIHRFQQLDQVIQKYLVKEVIGKCSGSMRDISAKHIEAVVSLFQKQVGRTQMLPYGIVASREYEGVSICRGTLEEVSVAPIVIEKIPATIQHQQLGSIEFTLLDPKEVGIIHEKSYTKWFDYDKIEQSICLRTRRETDYIALNHITSQKKLNRYFIGEKIPSCQRDHMMLLADGTHIMWVIGHRMSEYYKVTKETKQILQVTMKECT